MVVYVILYVIYIESLTHGIEIINIVQTLDEAIEVSEYDGSTMSWNSAEGLMTIKYSNTDYTAYIKRMKIAL